MKEINLFQRGWDSQVIDPTVIPHLVFDTLLRCYVVTLLRCYVVTLLRCYVVTLLRCYVVTLLRCYVVLLCCCVVFSARHNYLLSHYTETTSPVFTMGFFWAFAASLISTALYM
jgi:hypothetical protein